MGKVLRRQLVINEARCFWCDRPSGKCRCQAHRIVGNASPDDDADDPESRAASASKQAGAASLKTEHPQAAAHAMAAVASSDDAQHADAAALHKKAAAKHERAATQARMDGDDTAASMHDDAAALHRKAASCHSAVGQDSPTANRDYDADDILPDPPPSVLTNALTDYLAHGDQHTDPPPIRPGLELLDGDPDGVPSGDDRRATAPNDEDVEAPPVRTVRELLGFEDDPDMDEENARRLAGETGDDVLPDPPPTVEIKDVVQKDRVADIRPSRNARRREPEFLIDPYVLANGDRSDVLDIPKINWNYRP